MKDGRATAEATSPMSTATDARTIALGDGRLIRLGEVIGQGTSAMVHRALLSAPYKVRRFVAAKLFVHPGSEDAESVRDAVCRTVRKTACVHHPNVVTPIDFTVHEGRAVVVSELVEGASLATLKEAFAKHRRRMPPDLALFVALEIAEALAGARDARTPDGTILNMRHHDLSAREVLLSWHGEVKVTDFGVTAALRGGSGITSLADVARRCATMAPEVVAGSRGDARSDVFSLGIILREMLVGPRFPASMPDAQKIALAGQGEVPIGLMEPAIAEPIDSILRRALEIQPNHRYPDAGRMAFDLRRAGLSMGVGDGRVFLRTTMRDLLGAPAIDGEPTNPEARAATESGEISSPAISSSPR